MQVSYTSLSKVDIRTSGSVTKLLWFFFSHKNSLKNRSKNCIQVMFMTSIYFIYIHLNNLHVASNWPTYYYLFIFRETAGLSFDPQNIWINHISAKCISSGNLSLIPKVRAFCTTLVSKMNIIVLHINLKRWLETEFFPKKYPI